ncbi:MAG: cobalamin biosynthesis protein [Gammaproteobacteria bacterium]|nr:cobalamin biosynthesis protein [Gammaproteobacteria bacterium]
MLTAFNLSNLVLGDFTIRALQLLAVLLLDRFITVPSAYHPGVFFKYLAQQLSRRVNQRSSSHQRLAGTSLLLLLLALIIGFTWTLMSFAAVSWFYEIVMLWLLLSSRAQFKQTQGVARSIKQGHKILAREQLQLLCLRQTSNLSTVGIVKAAIEALPQRLASAYFNPLLIFACGGIYPAVAAVTVTSLANHWNPKLTNYRFFGRSASYLSQIISLPCRCLIALNIVILFGNFSAISQSLVQAKQWHRFGNGLLLSVVALALNCQLGGAVIYQTTKIRRPVLGYQPQPTISHISDVIRICQQVRNSWLLMLIVALTTSLALDLIRLPA